MQEDNAVDLGLNVSRKDVARTVLKMLFYSATFKKKSRVSGDSDT